MLSKRLLSGASDASPEDGASSHNAPGQNKSAQIDEPEDDDYKIGLIEQRVVWHAF